MDKKIAELLENLGVDTISNDQLQSDVNEMIDLLSSYSSGKIQTTTGVAMYSAKQQDVLKYQEKWCGRLKAYSDVIKHLRSLDFINCMKSEGEDDRVIYGRYLPVIQSLYDCKENAKQCVDTARHWIDLYQLLVGIEGEVT